MPGITSSLAQVAESSRTPLILSVCETAMGGVGRYQESLRGLTGAGFRLAILMPDKDLKILADLSEVRTYRRDKRGPAALLRLLAGFRKHRRDLRPDLYIFNSTFALLPLLALRLSGDRTPAVYCAHCWAISNHAETSSKGRVIRFVEGRLSGLADLVVNVSQGDAALARRLGYRGRQVVVENAVPDRAVGVMSERFERGSDDEVHLLFVGRFDWQKGLDILLGAFELARQEAPHLRLHLVGSAVRGTQVIDQLEGVTNHGWCSADEIDSFYASADALVVPSRWEGLPLTVPEALRNGTPVLVADKSGMASLVTLDVTGGVFDLSTEALAACLVVLNRPTLRAMRPAARASYEQRFAMSRFVPELAGHLNALIERPGA